MPSGSHFIVEAYLARNYVALFAAMCTLPLLRAEVRQVKMDYLDSAFHPKRAEEIFLQERHTRVVSDPALQEMIIREIGDDESFARAIADRHGATPATPDMVEAATRCIEDRATLKEFGHKQKLTILSAKPDSGEHSGPVLQIAGDYILQDSGRGVAILHRQSRLEGDKTIAAPGANVKIVYQNGRGEIGMQIEKHLSLSR